MTAKKQVVDWRIGLAAIVAVVILEAIALMKGINGTMFSIAMVLIGAIAGIVIPTPKQLLTTK